MLEDCILTFSLSARRWLRAIIHAFTPIVHDGKSDRLHSTESAMGMTLTEKILARKTGQSKVSPGDLVTVEVDTIVFVDTMFVPTRWRKIKQLDHPERVIVVLDHRAPVPDKQGAATHQTARAFAAQFGGISGKPPGMGGRGAAWRHHHCRQELWYGIQPSRLAVAENSRNRLCDRRVHQRAVLSKLCQLRFPGDGVPWSFSFVLGR
jgi:hypothetical protein